MYVLYVQDIQDMYMILCPVCTGYVQRRTILCMQSAEYTTQDALCFLLFLAYFIENKIKSYVFVRKTTKPSC